MHENLRKGTHDPSFNQAKQIEYHYDLALRLRPNFPLAALNLASHLCSFGHDDGAKRSMRVGQALQLYEACAFRMDPGKSKTYQQHVQVQIECLISGAKLMRADFRTNIAERKCDPRSVDWTKFALAKVEEISDSWPKLEARISFGDLNKQLATIYHIQAECCNSPESRQILLEKSKFHAFESQISIPFTIYQNFVDNSSSQENSIRLLRRAIEKEAPVSEPTNLAKLHYKLAKILSGRTESNEKLAEAFEELNKALRLEPNNFNSLTLGGQLAYDLNQRQTSEQLYGRAVALIEAELQVGCSKARSDSNARHHHENRKLAAAGSAHANYGAILQVNKKLGLALAEYRQALDCDPTNRVASTNLARLERGSLG